MPGTCGGQRRVQDPLEWKWLLGAKPQSFIRTARALPTDLSARQTCSGWV